MKKKDRVFPMEAKKIKFKNFPPLCSTICKPMLKLNICKGLHFSHVVCKKFAGVVELGPTLRPILNAFIKVQESQSEIRIFAIGIYLFNNNLFTTKSILQNLHLKYTNINDRLVSFNQINLKLINKNISYAKLIPRGKDRQALAYQKTQPQPLILSKIYFDIATK